MYVQWKGYIVLLILTYGTPFWASSAQASGCATEAFYLLSDIRVHNWKKLEN